MNVPAETAAPQQGSYRHILKATSLLGGASAINMLVSMARAKVIALILGKAGVGVMGMYLSVSSLATSFASLGLNYSGVRELAEARGTGDDERMKRTLLTFRRLTLLLAVAGTAVLTLASPWVSEASFGNGQHTVAIAVLALTIAANLMTNYFIATIQAAGQVERVASYSVVSGVGGALVAIASFLIWRRGGIVTALVAGAAVQALLAWWFSRGAPFPAPDADTMYSREIASRLIQVGGLVVGIGMLSSFGHILVRAIVIREAGEAGAGIYQSAYGLSGMYAQYILGAMGTDYLPRVSAVISDARATFRMVNEQTAVALLLGLPGVLGTIVMAPLLIPFFYSREFGEAVPVLQLMAVGVYGRLLAWPMGFVLISRNEARACLLLEMLYNVTQVVTLWLALPLLGMRATGVALIVANAVFSLAYYREMAKRGMSWSREVWQALILGVLSMVLALATSWLLPPAWGIFTGSVLLLAVGMICLRHIASSADITATGLVRRLQSLLRLCGGNV